MVGLKLGCNKVKLLVSAITKLIMGFVFVMLILFLPAGTIAFRGAWRFIVLLFVSMFILGIVLFIKSPDLLKKRLNIKEKENSQKGVVGFSFIIFIVGFVVAGLDFRYSWSFVPNVVIIFASIIFLISYLIYAEVLRENAYLSQVVEVQENQKVVDTGLYSVVRHPMYMSTIFMFLMIPIILGSWWSFVVFAFYPILIAIRINNEEKVLTENLIGYEEYVKKVKYKILPFLW